MKQEVKIITKKMGNKKVVILKYNTIDKNQLNQFIAPLSSVFNQGQKKRCTITKMKLVCEYNLFGNR